MERRSVRILVWIALATPLVMDAVYFSLIRRQGVYPPDIFTVPFVALYLLLMAALLVSSLLVSGRPVWRAALRGGAAGGLIVIGVFGAFSIGAPLLIAGIIAAVAFALSVNEPGRLASLLCGGLAAALCAGTLVVGIDVVQRIIVCPPSSTEGGGGPGIILGPYEYQCSGGQVHWGHSIPRETG